MGSARRGGMVRTENSGTCWILAVGALLATGAFAADAPASIFVITAEDIRRSGAIRLAEALRLAPNLEVAQSNASSYAISARGFNQPSAIANKLLVLID